jgi:uncharacterized Ntn-hydrolase superfamily protein
VDRLITEDSGRERRQLGVVDQTGGAHAFTGAECAEWAGSRAGPGYTVQGNILVSDATVNTMAATFVNTARRPLAERLLESLKAGQAAGGDRQALHTIVVWRMNFHPESKTCWLRRRAEGKSDREIRRCLNVTLRDGSSACLRVLTRYRSICTPGIPL